MMARSLLQIAFVTWYLYDGNHKFKKIYCKRVKRVKNQTTKKGGWELIAIDPINSLKKLTVA
jgi:hypothetical protein